MRLEGNILTIMYVVPRLPEPDGWVSMTFFSKGTHGRYYCGFDLKRPLTEEQIQTRHYEGGLEQIDNPAKVDIRSKNLVWLTSDLEIYLASEDDPVRDPAKTLLHQHKFNL